MSKQMDWIGVNVSDRTQRGPKRGDANHVSAFCAEHGILTQSADARSDTGSTKWLALKPFPEHKGKDVFVILAAACVTYDDALHLAYGRTKKDAVRNLVRDCPVFKSVKAPF